MGASDVWFLLGLRKASEDPIGTLGAPVPIITMILTHAGAYKVYWYVYVTIERLPSCVMPKSIIDVRS